MIAMNHDRRTYQLTCVCARYQYVPVHRTWTVPRVVIRGHCFVLTWPELTPSYGTNLENAELAFLCRALHRLDTPPRNDRLKDRAYSSHGRTHFNIPTSVIPRAFPHTP